eukprot:5087183-Pyramimonas_sp.AAC.1
MVRGAVNTQRARLVMYTESGTSSGAPVPSGASRAGAMVLDNRYDRPTLRKLGVLEPPKIDAMGVRKTKLHDNVYMTDLEYLHNSIEYGRAKVTSDVSILSADIR